MKKTKNLVFTVLVMGLIATPALKVNAETLDESIDNQVVTTSVDNNQTQNVASVDNTTKVDATNTLDAGNNVTGTPDAGANAVTNAPVDPAATTTTPAATPKASTVSSIVVKKENGDVIINMSGLTGYAYVDYKTDKITITALDSSNNVVGDVITKVLADGSNIITYEIDSKSYTITIDKQTLISGLASDVRSAVLAKYTDNYSVYTDVDKNAIIVAHYITLDDDVETSMAYKYDFNVDNYKTVDAVMAALEEALKDTAPEVEVSSNDATLSGTALKKLKDTAKVIKADSWNAEWTIDATKLTGKEDGIDLRVAIDAGVKMQTREKIEKLLDEKDTRRIIDFYHSGNLPAGTQVSIYAGDRFNVNEVLTLYYYNSKTNKLEIANKDLKVDEDGMVTFTLDHSSSFVLLPTNNNAKNIQLLATRYNPQTGTMNVTLYVGLALASLAGIVVLRKQMN